MAEVLVQAPTSTADMLPKRVAYTGRPRHIHILGGPHRTNNNSKGANERLDLVIQIYSALSKIRITKAREARAVSWDLGSGAALPRASRYWRIIFSGSSFRANVSTSRRRSERRGSSSIGVEKQHPIWVKETCNGAPYFRKGTLTLLGVSSRESFKSGIEVSTYTVKQ